MYHGDDRRGPYAGGMDNRNERKTAPDVLLTACISLLGLFIVGSMLAWLWGVIDEIMMLRLVITGIAAWFLTSIIIGLVRGARSGMRNRNAKESPR